MSAILLVLAVGVLFCFLDTSAKYLVLSGMAAPFVSWARFASRYQLGVEIKSYEQIAQGNLDARPEEYSLIVIDEAHAYRHSDTARAQLGCRQMIVKNILMLIFGGLKELKKN